MGNERPYDRKIARAEKHLGDLNGLVEEYAATHPYHVLPGVQRHPDHVPYFLRFTAQPSPDAALILGDFLYNLRASLDYLMAALVPARNRSRVNFPTLWYGVWEPDVKGEDKQRGKDRTRWRRYTADVDPRALAIIQANQPPETAGDEISHHPLAIINKLRNADAHRDLRVVAGALRDVGGTAEFPGLGRRPLGVENPLAATEGLPDGAYLDLPADAMNVQITGTPVVLVRSGPHGGGYLIPEYLDAALDGTRKLMGWLRVYDRRKSA